MVKMLCFLSAIVPIFSLVYPVTSAVNWTSCGTGLDCGSLEVPLEYGSSSETSKATIALIRYNATVSSEKRLGSLLVNPGGPGASGVKFVSAGAGAAISILSGGRYDIIGWDPRGVGASTPLLQCFANAGAEYDFANALPGGPSLWLGSFSDSSFDSQIQSNITDFDAAVGALSDACVKQNSPALYTSSAAYVARDMAAIVDALDGADAKLNFWGLSYGTILLVEFIQAFPNRVGRIVADGVFDADANAKTYDNQLPNDQISVRDGLNDLIDLCIKAGLEGCALATAPTGVSATLTTRLDNIFEDLFKNPIVASGLSISLDVYNVLLWSLMRVPTTWQLLASVISGLENRNATLLLSVLSQVADAEPSDRSTAGVGTLSINPLQCVDNAPSGGITLERIISLTKTISISQDTPLLSAGLTPITFCRHFPSQRPLLPNLGVSLVSATNKVLAASSTKILIVNPVHDTVTPLKSARHLRSLLLDSSVLAVRGGSGHTTVSHASLGVAQTIYDFFTAGTLPEDGAFFPVDQVIFPSTPNTGLVTAASYNGTYASDQKALLDAVYGVGVAFLLM